MKFNRNYFLAAVLLLATEVFIALYVRDAFVRPYLGDFLVVILIYCVVKSFFDIEAKKAALGVLLFSYLVEILQYFRVIEIIGLAENKFAQVVLGTSFSWADMLAYTAGIIFILLTERIFQKRKIKESWLKLN